MHVRLSLLSQKVVKDVERRILNNFLDLLILSALHLYGGQTSGYEIIKYLQMRYGFLLSPGTVYSCLYHMERTELLKGKQNGRKRIYILTEYGEKTAKAILNAKERIINFISTILQNNCNLSHSLQLQP